MNNSRITIGMTCYNAEQTIELALKSALDQDWLDKEILIVDDCSTDGSVQVVKRFALNHSSIRLIQHQTNRGPGAARQTIVQESTGDYIAFFDDDDVSLPTRIRQQYMKLKEFEEQNVGVPVSCHASGCRIYPNGYKKDLPAIGSRPEIPHGSGYADALLFNGKIDGWFYGSYTPACSMMAKKNVIIQTGGFDPDFRRVEDADFAVRLALMGGYFIGTMENLFFQYATMGNDKTAFKNFLAERQLLKKHKLYLSQKGWYIYSCLWTRLRYYYFAKKYVRLVALLALLFLLRPIKTLQHFYQSARVRFMHDSRIRRNQRP